MSNKFNNFLKKALPNDSAKDLRDKLGHIYDDLRDDFRKIGRKAQEKYALEIQRNQEKHNLNLQHKAEIETAFKLKHEQEMKILLSVYDQKIKAIDDTLFNIHTTKTVANDEASPITENAISTEDLGIATSIVTPEIVLTTTILNLIETAVANDESTEIALPIESELQSTSQVILSDHSSEDISIANDEASLITENAISTEDLGIATSIVAPEVDLTTTILENRDNFIELIETAPAESIEMTLPTESELQSTSQMVLGNHSSEDISV